MLRFDDGVDIDTSGPLRVESLEDGLYVVGDGISIPVRDKAEADEILAEFKAKGYK